MLSAHMKGFTAEWIYSAAPLSGPFALPHPREMGSCLRRHDLQHIRVSLLSFILPIRARGENNRVFSVSQKCEVFLLESLRP